MNRNIFKYNNGEKDFRYDPLKVEIMLAKASAKINIAATHSKFAGPDWFQARFDENFPEKLKENNVTDEVFAFALSQHQESIQELIPVICETFNIKEFDSDPENGWTWNQILDIYIQFLDFRDGVKKNTDMNASSLQPSDVVCQTTMSANLDTTGIPNSRPESGPSPSQGESITPSLGFPTLQSPTPSQKPETSKK